jgi:hypothetical protein
MRSFAVATLLLVSCGNPHTGTNPLPAQVADWKLTQKSDSPEISQPMRDLGASTAWSGMYEGPSQIRVEVYRMATDANAFEAMQKWRPEAGSMAFHKLSYFVVARGVEGLRDFTAALERVIGSGG